MADKIGIDQTNIATEETLGSLTSLVHRMIENIINAPFDTGFSKNGKSPSIKRLS